MMEKISGYYNKKFGQNTDTLASISCGIAPIAVRKRR
jgi:hypothetical protein